MELQLIGMPPGSLRNICSGNCLLEKENVPNRTVLYTISLQLARVKLFTNTVQRHLLEYLLKG